MLIKASRVVNLTDARYFSAKGVDYLGFNLEEGTESYLDPSQMKAIREWVAGPKITGEFSTLSAAYAAEAAVFFELDAVELNADKHLPELHLMHGIETLLRVRGSLDTDVIAYIIKEAAPFVSGFILDFSGEGQWEELIYRDTDLWNELLGTKPVLLDAPLDAKHLPRLFKDLNLAGLSLRGGEEEKVGVKSFEDLDEIFDVLELV